MAITHAVASHEVPTTDEARLGLTAAYLKAACAKHTAGHRKHRDPLEAYRRLGRAHEPAGW